VSLLTSLLPVGRPVTTKPVHPSNAYLVRVYAEQWQASTDRFVPLLGAELVCNFALDAANQSPIAALQGFTLTEVGPQAVGVYAEVIPGATMDALLPFIGQTVYQLTSSATTGDVLVATQLRVQYPRYAQ
jgi:hypothetical protein